MKAFLSIALLLVGATPADQPRGYLLSIGRVPLKDTESIEAFSIKTWGVEFRSVCHIPSGWRITAGNSATPNGEISGEGSQGVTWFRQSSPRKLQNLLLVTLYGPVQRETIGTVDDGIPATFIGKATISTDDGEVQRTLSYRNITLAPARRCPA